MANQLDASDRPSAALMLMREQRNILLRALREIRDMDYRGNRHPSATIAYEALKEIGDEPGGRTRPNPFGPGFVTVTDNGDEVWHS